MSRRSRGNPLWVTYHLTASNGEAARYKRPGRFETDWRSLARIGHDDYAHSGYTRGHLAPSHTIAQHFGRAAQLDTFLMTNISPQRPELNNKIWQSIEKWEADTAVQRYGNVWVITGPIFDNAVERLTSSLQVEIPDAFYKIVVVPEGSTRDTPLLYAFIVPQKATGTETMESFLTSVDRVEELSGFDFFSELPDELEQRLESGKPNGVVRARAVDDGRLPEDEVVHRALLYCPEFFTTKAPKNITDKGVRKS